SSPGSARTDAARSLADDLIFHCFRLPARLDFAAICGDEVRVEADYLPSRHCLLDMEAVTFIDSTGVGFLIRLQKTIHAAGRQLILLRPGPNVRRALAVMRVDTFFLTTPDIESARETILARACEQSAAVGLQLETGNPILTWHGEITAANADAIWERT